MVFCYHGRRGDTYHVRGIDFVSPGRIAFVVSPEPLCVIGFVVRSRRLTPIVYRQLIHLLLALPLLALPTLGQETVFDVPSPDLLDKHKVYGELDGTARPVDPVYTFEPRVVVGLGHGIEAGLNFIGLSEPSSGQVILAPTVKWRLWNSGESAWSFFVGDNVFFPVRKRDHNAANYFYAEFAKVFRRGTRIGLGGYDFTKNVVAPAQRAGGQFTLEQPINKRLTVAAEWYTGNHAAGYVSPGLIAKATSKLTLWVLPDRQRWRD